MAIRIRVINGSTIAICAAKSEEKEGDVYLNDGVHHALTTKFGIDFMLEGFINEHFSDNEVLSLMKQQQSGLENVFMSTSGLNIPCVIGSESSSILIYKLECVTEDGCLESNGYYKTIEKAELIKAEMDKYPMNMKYGIKQQIVPIDLED